jgi:rfaE bifunctional protein nucleotidyltransferase chain/domain
LDKVCTIEELARVVEDLKRLGKKVVHAHGVFDLIHPGHIRHLETARRFGDALVVTITPDHFVNKGPGRPYFPQALRAEFMAALACVDHVAINEWATAVETIGLIRPDVYVKGSEYEDHSRDLTGKIRDEVEAVEAVGGRIEFTCDITFSSTNLLNGFFNVFPEKATAYVQELRTRVSADLVIEAVHRLTSLRVLVVGDTIIDEYHYVQPMAKSPKENVIATRYISEERFAGGVLAAANHTANLCDRVDLFTCLGGPESHEGFIRGHLKRNVGLTIFERDDAPTVVKRRFVDDSYKRKLFEICFLKQEPIAPDLEARVCDQLRRVLPDYDLVLVTDFGHGFIGPRMVQTLVDHAPFLAVNVQSNSANLGFNLITKYPRADYISIDDPEARLATQEPLLELPEVIERLRGRIRCDRLAITHGQHGCLVFGADEGFVRIPAFTTRVLDTVGAGDAFLAISAPCAAAGMPMEWVGLMGNAAGAMKVEIIGHRSSIEKAPLLKTIAALLK